MAPKNRNDVMFFHFPGTGSGQGYKYPKFISDNYETMELADIMGANDTPPAVHSKSYEVTQEEIDDLAEHYENLGSNFTDLAEKFKSVPKKNKSYLKKAEDAYAIYDNDDKLSDKIVVKKRNADAKKMIKEGMLQLQTHKIFEGIAMLLPTKVARILGQLFGTGYITNTERVLKRLKEKKNSKEKLPKEIVLEGTSRGAINAIMAAKAIHIKYGNKIKVHLCLTDPVPGPFHDANPGIRTIPPNVSTCNMFYTSDDKRGIFFKPFSLNEVAFMNKKTIVTSYAFKNIDHAELDEDIPQLKFSKYELFAGITGQTNDAYSMDKINKIEKLDDMEEMKNLRKLYIEWEKNNKLLEETKKQKAKIETKEKNESKKNNPDQNILILPNKKSKELAKKIGELSKDIEEKNKYTKKSVEKLSEKTGFEEQELLTLIKIGATKDYMFKNSEEMQDSTKNRNFWRRLCRFLAETKLENLPKPPSEGAPTETLIKALKNIRRCFQNGGLKENKEYKDPKGKEGTKNISLYETNRDKLKELEERLKKLKAKDQNSEELREIDQKVAEKRKHLEPKGTGVKISEDFYTNFRNALCTEMEQELEETLKKAQTKLGNVHEDETKKEKTREAEIDAACNKKLKYTIPFEKVAACLLILPILGFSANLHQSKKIKNNTWKALYFSAGILTFNILPVAHKLALNAINLGSVILNHLTKKTKRVKTKSWQKQPKPTNLSMEPQPNSTTPPHI